MALKIEANIPVTATFPWGDFREVPNTFNGKNTMQYLYTVEVDGAKDKLYATEKLHQILQEAGMKKGSRFVITKETSGNRTAWKVEPAEGRSSPAPQSAGSRQSGTPAETLDVEAATGGVFGLMARCLRESLNAYRWLGIDFTADNVQASGNTLFIEMRRNGITLPAVAYPTPEQVEALARIREAVTPEQKARLEKKIAEGMAWAEAQAIIDYYEQHVNRVQTA